MQNTHSQKIQHVLLQHDKTRDLFYHSYMDTQNTATLGPLLSSGIILERTGLQNYQTITFAFGFQISLLSSSRSHSGSHSRSGQGQGQGQGQDMDRSWSGHGQVRSNSNSNSNSKVGPELYTKIGFHSPPPPLTTTISK